MLPDTRNKKRGAYGRPCDLCASRRVRCDVQPGSSSCKKCLSLNIPCTNDRVRLKSGPKRGRKARKESWSPKDTNIRDKQTEASFATPDTRMSTQATENNPMQTKTHIDSSAWGHHATSSHSDILESFPQVQNQSLNHSSLGQVASSQFSPRVPFFPYMAQSQGPRFATMPTGPTGDSQQRAQAPTVQPSPPQMPQNEIKVAEDPLDVFTVKSVNADSPALDPGRFSTENGDIRDPSSSKDGAHAKLSLEHLLSRLQVYQTWFYGYWPILSVAELISVISDGAQLGYEDNFITLTTKNASAYSLCCAVCAAITTQLSFVSSTNSSLNCNAISANAYANESKRVRDLFDYRDSPDMNTLLISFFLYAHYVNTPEMTKSATLYLREAISIGQVLNFYSPRFFQGKSRAEVHRWRKIYYTLLVTERYMCFECGIPIILEPCVEYPDLDDEEYPSLIYGFTELVKVFSAPGKKFFGELNDKSLLLSDSGEVVDKRQWINAVQSQLQGNRTLPKNVTQSQRLNIILSEAWIRAIAWEITSDNGMLRQSTQKDDHFSYEFPLFNVRSFLNQTRDLPEVAFETNGPGVFVKLIELAKTLTSSIPKLTLGEKASNLVTPVTSKLQDLESLFSLVTKFKNDITMKSDDYQAIANFIFQSKFQEVPRAVSNYGWIEEIRNEDSEDRTVENDVMDSAETDPGLTFFQSMNSIKNFGTSPKFGSNTSLSAFMHDSMG